VLEDIHILCIPPEVMASINRISLYFFILGTVISQGYGLLESLPLVSTVVGGIGKKGVLGTVMHTLDDTLAFLPREPEDAAARPYEASFCYDRRQPCGQHKWDGVCKTGKRQSPINIRTKQTLLVNASKNPLEFNSKYSRAQSGFYVANNGHSVVVQLRPKGRSELELHVSDLNLTFRFSHIHFHWNSLDHHKGSEHRIDGHGHDMEIHFVHYRSSFPSIEEALKSGEPNLAAVVGMFVDVGAHNHALDPAIKAIEKFALNDTHGHRRINETFSVSSILPKTDRFFRYQGSLTVPKCIENLLWLLMEDPIQISKEQMKTFRRVICHNCPEHKMKNVRRAMPRNERTIEYFNAHGTLPTHRKEEVTPEEDY